MSAAANCCWSRAALRTCRRVCTLAEARLMSTGPAAGRRRGSGRAWAAGMASCSSRAGSSSGACRASPRVGWLTKV
eukprot:6964978-Lingulodinium_polyedra.AAC.1